MPEIEEGLEVLNHSVLRAVLALQMQLFLLVQIESFHDLTHDHLHDDEARIDALQFDKKSPSGEHLASRSVVENTPGKTGLANASESKQRQETTFFNYKLLEKL